MIRGLSDTGLLFSPSVVSSGSLFVGGVDGTIHAMNPDGTFRWSSQIEGQRLTSSLVIGSQGEPTETPEPEETPTPTGTLVEPSITTTPTATQTPLRLNSTLLGVTESGTLVALDSSNGKIISPAGLMPSTPTEGTVVSSPALSADLFLTYGTTGGQLFSINTANGQLPRFCSGGDNDGDLCTDNIDCVDGFCAPSVWPILLPRSCRTGERRSRLCDDDDDCPGSVCERPAIRSSPSMDLDGTIYFGADDGRLYVVGVSGEVTPGETSSPGPTPTPPPATIPPLTATATFGAESTPTATIDVEPSVSPTPPPADSPSVSPTPDATVTDTVASTEAATQEPTPAESSSPSPQPTTTEEPIRGETPAASPTAMQP
jgi:outer membrane protein assembly factor BamB